MGERTFEMSRLVDGMDGGDAAAANFSSWSASAAGGHLFATAFGGGIFAASLDASDTSIDPPNASAMLLRSKTGDPRNGKSQCRQAIARRQSKQPRQPHPPHPPHHTHTTQPPIDLARNLRSKSCNTIEPWVREMCNVFPLAFYYLAFPRLTPWHVGDTFDSA